MRQDLCHGKLDLSSAVPLTERRGRVSIQPWTPENPSSALLFNDLERLP